MKRNVQVAIGGLFLATLFILGGCGKTTGSKAGTLGAIESGMAVFNQLGGMDTVNKLAEAFGANLTANPTLSKLLGTTGIDQTKKGLVNEIAKTGGVAQPNPGVDLYSTLANKKLDANAVNGLTQALSSATKSMNLTPTQQTAVMGVLAPITSKLLGG